MTVGRRLNAPQGPALTQVRAPTLRPHTTHVRDSKLGAGSPRFTVPADAWAAFLAYAAREA